jgi:hypothetical protein
MILASGSGYRASNKPGRIEMQVYVDGYMKGRARLFTNETGSHKTFVSDYTVVTGLSAGYHSIGLAAIASNACGTASETNDHVCTTTDTNDYFQVAVIEIPS